MGKPNGGRLKDVKVPSIEEATGNEGNPQGNAKGRRVALLKNSPWGFKKARSSTKDRSSEKESRAKKKGQV